MDRYGVPPGAEIIAADVTLWPGDARVSGGGAKSARVLHATLQATRERRRVAVPLFSLV